MFQLVLVLSHSTHNLTTAICCWWWWMCLQWHSFFTICIVVNLHLKFILCSLLPSLFDLLLIPDISWSINKKLTTDLHHGILYDINIQMLHSYINIQMAPTSLPEELLFFAVTSCSCSCGGCHTPRDTRTSSSSTLGCTILLTLSGCTCQLTVIAYTLTSNVKGNSVLS